MAHILAWSTLNASFIASASGQYQKAIETIVPKSHDLMALQVQSSFAPSGKKGHFLVYRVSRAGKNSSVEQTLKVIYSETARQVIDTATLTNELTRIFDFVQLDSLMVLHGLSSVAEQDKAKALEEFDGKKFIFNYQDIWVQVGSRIFFLKSFAENYYDLDVEYMVNHEQNTVLISTFVSEYLRSSPNDSIISMFTQLPNKKGFISSEINCRECIKPQIVDEYIYFGKKFEYLHGSDAYDWKIYRAPIGDIRKMELIAEYIEILLVSPDGNYILGKRNLYGKSTLVIVDIKSRKFQYLLGRNYNALKYFYSPGYRRFAFDREADILYLDFPQTFPFQSTGMEAARKHTSRQQDAEFWNIFEPKR